MLRNVVASINLALEDAAVIQRFADLGAVPVPEASATPGALQERVKAEVQRWGPVIKSAGQYAD